MSFDATIQTYFTGMRNEGLFSTVPMGIVLLIFAAALLRGPRDTFALWAGIPLGVAGLIGVVAGISFAIYAGSHLPETLSAYQADPAATLQSEAARIDGILRGSNMYYAMYGALMVAAFVLLFAVHRDWSIGLALPLMAFAAMSFCGDVLIHKRTITYQAAIVAAQAE